MDHYSPLQSRFVEPSNSSFYTVLVYQDLHTGVRAKNVANRIREEMADERTFELDAWNIGLLDHPVFHRLASDQAVAAEIIILSLHDGRALTTRLKGWLKAWMHQKQGVCPALIALFSDQGDSSSVFAKQYLETAAQRAGMEFLCQQLGPSDSNPEADTELCWIL
jgi:hypothetical protein